MSKFKKFDHWKLPDSQKSTDTYFFQSHSDTIVAGIMSEASCQSGTKLLMKFQPQ